MLLLAIERPNCSPLLRPQNFEINPRHPLIERLLEKVEEAGDDEDAQEELNESVTVLWCVWGGKTRPHAGRRN